MAPTADALARARESLYAYQARWAQGMPKLERAGREGALKQAVERENSAVWDGESVLLGGLRFEADKERARFARTRELIDRVLPGPYEDGAYFEMLCRQAATIELLLANSEGNDAVQPFLDAVILGTIGEPRSHASTRLEQGSVPRIALSAGMMYSYYQVSKAVVLAWMQIDAESEGARVVLSSKFEDTVAHLDADPTPVHIVAETICNWLLTGVARPNNSTAPPPELQLPLGLMINYAERFVLAHEYAHAFIDQLGVGVWGMQPSEVENRDREFRADIVATVLVAESAGFMDSVAPNIALQGAVVGMKVHEMLDDALVMARGGRALPASTTHPAFADRFQLLVSQYMETYGALGDDRLNVRGLLVARQTVDELWRRATPIVSSMLQAKPTLHPVWEPALQ